MNPSCKLILQCPALYEGKRSRLCDQILSFAYIFGANKRQSGHTAPPCLPSSFFPFFICRLFHSPELLLASSFFFSPARVARLFARKCYGQNISVKCSKSYTFLKDAKTHPKMQTTLRKFRKVKGLQHALAGLAGLTLLAPLPSPLFLSRKVNAPNLKSTELREEEARKEKMKELRREGEEKKSFA